MSNDKYQLEYSIDDLRRLATTEPNIPRRKQYAAMLKQAQSEMQKADGTVYFIHINTGAQSSNHNVKLQAASDEEAMQQAKTYAQKNGYTTYHQPPAGQTSEREASLGWWTNKTGQSAELRRGPALSDALRDRIAQAKQKQDDTGKAQGAGMRKAGDGIEEAARKMADNLMNYARKNGVDISGVTLKNFNTYLDDQFDDGGEARCERFLDLGDEYAMQFGDLETKSFDDAKWKCITRAIQIVRQEFKASAKKMAKADVLRMGINNDPFAADKAASAPMWKGGLAGFKDTSTASFTRYEKTVKLNMKGDGKMVDCKLVVRTENTGTNNPWIWQLENAQGNILFLSERTFGSQLTASADASDALKQADKSVQQKAASAPVRKQQLWRTNPGGTGWYLNANDEVIWRTKDQDHTGYRGPYSADDLGYTDEELKAKKQRLPGGPGQKAQGAGMRKGQQDNGQQMLRGDKQNQNMQNGKPRYDDQNRDNILWNRKLSDEEAAKLGGTWENTDGKVTSGVMEVTRVKYETWRKTGKALAYKGKYYIASGPSTSTEPRWPSQGKAQGAGMQKYNNSIYQDIARWCQNRQTGSKEIGTTNAVSLSRAALAGDRDHCQRLLQQIINDTSRWAAQDYLKKEAQQLLEGLDQADTAGPISISGVPAGGPKFRNL